MRRHLALAAAAALTAAAPAQADFELGIIHINDLHSRMEPISKYDGPCKAEDDAAGKCFGGIARVAAKIAELRARHAAEGRPALVLDAGDQFQGSLFYTTYKGAAAAEFMNLIGFDAMAVGNHEFDDGPEGLAGFLDKVRFPVISGNLDVSANNRLAGRVAPYAILDAGGRKVGVVSALATDTAETSSPGPTVRFADEAESLRAAVAELEGQGVNVIIALTHVGLPPTSGWRKACPASTRWWAGTRTPGCRPRTARRRGPIRSGSAARATRWFPWCRPMPIRNSSAT